MQESEIREVTVFIEGRLPRTEVPGMVEAAGGAAAFAWEEFFLGQLPNRHTRTAYLAAVRRFLAWVAPRERDLARITPGLVGSYFDKLLLSVPSKKLHLAALRTFFDVLVQRHVMVLNPARSVRTERYTAIEGRTPEISVDQARRLLGSISLDSVAGLRDRAVVAVLIYTAARAGAIAKLRLGDFVSDGTQYLLRFAEKGGKARSIPVRHNLELFIRDYLLAAGLEGGPKDAPLFRTIAGVQQRLSDRPMNGVDICRMVKRRLQAAGLPTTISPHSFRSCAATDLLLQGVALEDVQYLLGHADARTTRLYDRRQKQITRNIVERISV
jgi:site-specific recombinase XerD